ncbi:MAG: acetyl-CoA C-acyltransferase [Rhodospirillaceae bacterium]|jgi:acetyl-CoA acyltransferase|nr:acetyl-CoA C-acyltransferase [Rhodospirillaceae bacterium]MDP6622416.1 thiolase family protein [Alphaproteobacteria bacterium]|tara:strand:- start:427 stop:1563 length:1137 start_codon:yes stop_codon:yes gene_type:complete
MNNVVIAGYARSPFAPAKKGELAKVRPDELAAQVVKALIERSAVNVDDIEDVIMGCAMPEGEQGFNIARMVGFLAKLPLSAAGTTVNRFCGSSMQSIHIAAGAISMNAGQAFVCAGVESMTRIPMGGFNPSPHPGLYGDYPEAYVGMGITAENLAKKYDLSRQEQQEFAVSSHQKAAAARDGGKLSDEIVTIVDGNLRVEQDGCIRPETTTEGLDGLDPAFDQAGTVTAGTSSPLTDGAAAVLVCSEDYADAQGLEKLARIKSIAVSGCAPEIMGIGPVGATEKALERAGIGLADIDVIELNEAFAAQALAVIKEAGMDQQRINLDGGAIALGHPLGASGARITGKAAQLMKREGKSLALATQCIGGGQGIATVMEAC